MSAGLVLASVPTLMTAYPQMTEQRERMDTLFQLVDSIAAKLGERF